MKWRSISRQASRCFIFPHRSFRDMIFSGVSSHIIINMYQQRERQRQTFCEGTRILALQYPHRGQSQPQFPPLRDNPLCPISGHFYLKWEELPMMLQPHVSGVCWSLHMSCKIPHKFMPTYFSGDYSRDLQAPLS